MDTFVVTSGKLQVTDPCYDMDTWCAATLENVKNGKYHVEINRGNTGMFGDVITELLIYHESIISKKHKLNFRWIDSNIGVDSGQAGFFDYDKLNEIKLNEQLDDSFYKEMCEFTLEADCVGANEFGCVSSSGYGDGVYSLWVAEKNGEVVAAKIVFVSELEDDDYNEI